MKWTNVLFLQQTAGTKKNISPVPKGAESQKGDRQAKTPVLKDKFLSKFLWRVAKYNLNEQAPHVGAKWVWIKRSRLTCTLTISCKLHFKSNQSSKSLQKLHTGQIFCFAGYPSLIFTILRRGRLKQHDPRFVRSSWLESANYTLLHTKWLPCTAILYEHCLSIKNPFKDVKLTNNENYQGYFRP